MSKAAQTRQLIIERTATVFNKKGFAGTSLSDMVEVTGLTKGSIYGNFKNKEEVALAVYRYNTGQLSKNMKGWIAESKGAHSRLLAFVDFYRQNWKAIFENGGCPILNAAAESGDTMPSIKATVKITLEGWEKTISRIIEEGIKEKKFKQEKDPEEYAGLFIMMIEGGILRSKIADSPEKLYVILDRIVKIINEELAR